MYKHQIQVTTFHKVEVPKDGMWGRQDTCSNFNLYWMITWQESGRGDPSFQRDTELKSLASPALAGGFWALCHLGNLTFQCFVPWKWKFLESSVMSASLRPMDGSLPDSSIHEILQARIPVWVAIPFSKGFSRPKDWTQFSCIEGRFLLSEPPGKSLEFLITLKFYNFLASIFLMFLKYGFHQGTSFWNDSLI